jgi:hypothetical protein
MNLRCLTEYFPANFFYLFSLNKQRTKRGTNYCLNQAFDTGYRRIIYIANNEIFFSGNERTNMSFY